MFLLPCLQKNWSNYHFRRQCVVFTTWHVVASAMPIPFNFYKRRKSVIFKYMNQTKIHFGIDIMRGIISYCYKMDFHGFLADVLGYSLNIVKYF